MTGGPGYASIWLTGSPLPAEVVCTDASAPCPLGAGFLLHASARHGSQPFPPPPVNQPKRRALLQAGPKRIATSVWRKCQVARLGIGANSITAVDGARQRFGGRLRGLTLPRRRTRRGAGLRSRAFLCRASVPRARQCGRPAAFAPRASSSFTLPQPPRLVGRNQFCLRAIASKCRSWRNDPLVEAGWRRPSRPMPISAGCRTILPVTQCLERASASKATAPAT